VKKKIRNRYECFSEKNETHTLEYIIHIYTLLLYKMFIKKNKLLHKQTKKKLAAQGPIPSSNAEDRESKKPPPPPFSPPSCNSHTQVNVSGLEREGEAEAERKEKKL